MVFRLVWAGKSSWHIFGRKRTKERERERLELSLTLLTPLKTLLIYSGLGLHDILQAMKIERKRLGVLAVGHDLNKKREPGRERRELGNGESELGMMGLYYWTY